MDVVAGGDQSPQWGLTLWLLISDWLNPEGTGEKKGAVAHSGQRGSTSDKALHADIKTQLYTKHEIS